MSQDNGASAAPTGLSQAEPKVSALRASIPSADVTIPRELYDFLMGTGPLEGTWFNEMNSGRLGAFWWRALLRTCEGRDAIDGVLLHSVGGDPKHIRVSLTAGERQFRLIDEYVCGEGAGPYHWAALASGIEARSDETPQAAQPVGREPGGNAATPETSQSEGPTS